MAAIEIAIPAILDNADAAALAALAAVLAAVLPIFIASSAISLIIPI